MQMTTSNLLWPTKDEYNLTISRWKQTLGDADLRSGQLAQDQLGICRFGGANLYVCVYKIGNWMVRCFCSNPPHQTPFDICDRYRAIDQFCRINMGRVSALIPVTYLEQGILVGQRIFPVVKMPFLVGCPPLGEFIMERYSERTTMWRLSEGWLRMIREMEAASIAHGDLDLTNVLVEERGSDLILKLIDYDNVWIPELAGRPQTEYGHASFQHPNFLPPRPRPYNLEMDRFSTLAMYISLKMLAVHPELYEQWGADESDRLLLSEADYKNAGLSDSRLLQLRNLADKDLQPYILELYDSLRENRMPCSLDEIARAARFNENYAPPAYSAPQQTTFALQPAPLLRPAVAQWQNAVYSAAPGAGPGVPWTPSPQPQPQPQAPTLIWGKAPSLPSKSLPSKSTKGSASWIDDASKYPSSTWGTGTTGPVTTQPWGTSGPSSSQLWGVSSPPKPLFGAPPTARYQSAQGQTFQQQQKNKRAKIIFSLLLLLLLIVIAILFMSGAFAHIFGHQAWYPVPGRFEAVSHARPAFLFLWQGIL